MRIPLDQSLWPREWSVVNYKDYPRFEKIRLSKRHPKADLFEAIKKRASRRDFSRGPTEKIKLSTLLKYSCGITQEGSERQHRAQPSGGGRYPIEVYPIVFAGSEEIRSGLYHYNVKAHALDVLWERAFLEEDIGEFFTYPWARKASLAVILTGVFKRNQMKYGERGYRQILIEAGSIVQNLYLTSTALGIKCCAIDGVQEPVLEKLLDVDGITESVLVSLVLG